MLIVSDMLIRSGFVCARVLMWSSSTTRPSCQVAVLFRETSVSWLPARLRSGNTHLATMQAGRDRKRGCCLKKRWRVSAVRGL